MLEKFPDGPKIEEALEAVDFLFRRLFFHGDEDVLGAFPGKDEGGKDDANEDGGGEVVEKNSDEGDHHDDDDLGEGDPSKGLERGPLEGPDDHHEHDPNEGGDGDLLDDRAAEENEGS